MITYFDLIQKDDFRSFVCKRISNSINQPYCFPTTIPMLYRYLPLSSYTIDDVINGSLTVTSIGEFNDVFDGAVHCYGSDEEIKQAAEAEWEKMELHMIAAHLPEGLLQKDSVVSTYEEYFKTESRLKFRELDYLGTYICCFSEDNTSTLMWAHYADSNRGMCLEYDFDKLPSENLLRDSFLPVAYADAPIDVRDLLEDKQNKIYQYPLDAAVLCSALNKSSIWQYEKEWRSVFVLATAPNKVQRLTINSLIKPSKIYLGYHFLRPFFYHDFKNTDERNTCTSILKKFMELIAFMQKNKIYLAVMAPEIGSYRLLPHDISADALYSFMIQYFHDGQPESMRYYYTVHDHLMDILEKAGTSH